MHNESVHHEEIDALTRLLVEQEGCSERVFRTVLHVPRRTHPGSLSVLFLCCTVESGVCSRVSHTPIVVACHPEHCKDNTGPVPDRRRDPFRLPSIRRPRQLVHAAPDDGNASE